MKNIFCVDMDNTIIYSYKHDIGERKLNVELYNGREISFISERTYSLLKKVNDRMLIVPTSTRTEEQYRRINLNIGAIPYALVCNGGVLLVNGERDKEWYGESLKMTTKSRPELDKAICILEEDLRRKFEVRFIDKLFVFTKCERPDEVIKDLKETLRTDLVDVFHNGEKVYVVPKDLNKGMAVKRLRKRMNPGYIMAAGDSEFDISMVEESDFGFVPDGFGERFHLKEDLKESVMEMESGKLFSEALLEKCLKTEAELK